MASALAAMEELGISHRDLRPSNIWYIASEKTYKIGGFDDAKLVDSS